MLAAWFKSRTHFVRERHEQRVMKPDSQPQGRKFAAQVDRVEYREVQIDLPDGRPHEIFVTAGVHAGREWTAGIRNSRESGNWRKIRRDDGEEEGRMAAKSDRKLF